MHFCHLRTKKRVLRLHITLFLDMHDTFCCCRCWSVWLVYGVVWNWCDSHSDFMEMTIFIVAELNAFRKKDMKRNFHMIFECFKYVSYMVNSFFMFFFHRNRSDWSVQVAESGRVPTIRSSFWKFFKFRVQWWVLMFSWFFWCFFVIFCLWKNKNDVNIRRWQDSYCSGFFWKRFCAVSNILILIFLHRIYM